MSSPEMPIFTRTFDLIEWLLPVTEKFPRAHRYSFTLRLLNTAFDLRERLDQANNRRGEARRERLQRADESLTSLRMYIRLAAHWQWLTPGQYQHVAHMLVEIGRLLGAWQKIS
ncbi:MAG: diversity-generating retroelement protein Avd [Anaerolineae bacterium]|nr:diversity-generating retroelement protein Avd [Anaerolineae bacterium]